MAKEEKVSLEGTVTDTLPDGQYMVEVEGGHQILGYTSGKMRRFNIRVLVGDRVTIETSPYDLNRGAHRVAAPVAPARRCRRKAPRRR